MNSILFTATMQHLEQTPMVSSKTAAACDGTKVSSVETHCRLVNVDIYSFDFKLNHIAKHMKLPAAPKLGPAALDMPPGERLPPVLVFNVQLPNYPVGTTSLQDCNPKILLPICTWSSLCINTPEHMCMHCLSCCYCQQACHELSHGFLRLVSIAPSKSA